MRAVGSTLSFATAVLCAFIACAGFATFVLRGYNLVSYKYVFLVFFVFMTAFLVKFAHQLVSIPIIDLENHKDKFQHLEGWKTAEFVIGSNRAPKALIALTIALCLLPIFYAVTVGYNYEQNVISSQYFVRIITSFGIFLSYFTVSYIQRKIKSLYPVEPIIWFNENTITIPTKCIIHLQNIDYVRVLYVRRSGLFMHIKSSDIPVLGNIKFPIENGSVSAESITTEIANYCFIKKIKFTSDPSILRRRNLKTLKNKDEKRQIARIMNNN